MSFRSDVGVLEHVETRRGFARHDRPVEPSKVCPQFDSIPQPKPVYAEIGGK